MAYTTVNNVLQIVPAINSLTNITSATVAAYITRVDNVINAKLAGSFSLPLVGDFPILEDIATDLVIYEIVGKRNMTLVSRDKESSWPSRFKEAAKLLDDIAEGVTPLLNSSLAALSMTTGGASLAWSNTMDYVPTMNEDDYTSFTQDTTKLDDIDDER